jgi:hypothetical protein
MTKSSSQMTLKHFLKLGACCAGPILGLALLAPLVGAAGVGVSALVSWLLVLACPLSMLLMLYAMGRGQQAARQDEGGAEVPRPDTALASAAGNGLPEGHEGRSLLESGRAASPSAHAMPWCPCGGSAASVPQPHPNGEGGTYLCSRSAHDGG